MPKFWPRQGCSNRLILAGWTLALCALAWQNLRWARFGAAKMAYEIFTKESVVVYRNLYISGRWNQLICLSKSPHVEVCIQRDCRRILFQLPPECEFRIPLKKYIVCFGKRIVVFPLCMLQFRYGITFLHRSRRSVWLDLVAGSLDYSSRNTIPWQGHLPGWRSGVVVD